MIERLLVNTGSNMLQLCVNMVVTFAMAPFYLEMMGHYDYGLREMVLALVGYMGMLDLGMRPTVSRFVAMHNAQNDRESLLSVYATSLTFMGVVGLLLAGFFWGWAVWFPDMVAPEGETTEKYSLFLLIIGAQLIFAFPRFVVESHLEGLQRYYFKNMINIVSTILLSILAYVYMTPDNALILFTFLVAVFAVIRLIIFMAILWRPAMGVIYPEVRMLSFGKLREMLRFGIKSFIQGAAQTIENMSDRLLIGLLMGPAAVPVYTIPQTLTGYVRGITMTLTHVFMPLFSDLNARGEQDKIKAIYLSSSKLVVGLVVPMSVGIALVGGPFIDIWMKGQFESSTVEAIVVLLAIYIAVPNLNPFASRFLTAINRHGIFARVAPFAALANLLLSIPLVIWYGPLGAALGSIVPVFVVTPIFLLRACHNLGVTPWQYVNRCLAPSVLPVVLMAAAVLGFRINFGLEGYVDIILGVGLGALVYGAVFWFFSVTVSERRWLMDLFVKNRREY